MAFQLPVYHPPGFATPPLSESPTASFEAVNQAGVPPKNYHATSIYPEYVHLQKGLWRLIDASRMDCVVVKEKDGALTVKEFRRLKIGDRVAVGRRENGEDGILVHTDGFDFPPHIEEKFAFRTHLTRETSFSIDYDELYELLEYERKDGFVVWVLGPAVVFDQDARNAFIRLVEKGYVHALLAGNALAAHDIEGAFFKTALGKEIYSKKTAPLGHYKHLDAIAKIRLIGSIKTAVEREQVRDGIMRMVIQRNIPYVLAGSIRDDGPLPETIADVYMAQDKMRALARRATSVIALATQLHAIATGNMVPSFKVMDDGGVRPVYFYTVDMSEFAINKLSDRGSLTARSILTNVQDFVVNVERGLRIRSEC
jgi:lysine-ketoglutarate reductase/saccharopine dehydrogenase-like protein (TIGR00300 family)